MLNTLINRRNKLLNNRRSAFSIVELVIIIAVIGILAGIFIPTYLSLTASNEAKVLQTKLNEVYLEYASSNEDFLDEREVAIVQLDDDGKAPPSNPQYVYIGDTPETSKWSILEPTYGFISLTSDIDIQSGYGIFLLYTFEKEPDKIDNLYDTYVSSTVIPAEALNKDKILAVRFGVDPNNQSNNTYYIYSRKTSVSIMDWNKVDVVPSHGTLLAGSKVNNGLALYALV